MLTVLVTAAGVEDSVAGERLLDRIAADHPGLCKGWAGRGCREYLVGHAAGLGIDLEVVCRASGTWGFAVLFRRWVVERALGWLMLRRLGRDYEALPTRSTAMINIAIIALIALMALMACRATRESIPTRRGA